MAEVSRFWTGIVTGDAGPYSAAQMADYMQNALIANRADSGPFMGSGAAPDPGLSVTQNGTPNATVLVSPGSALDFGYYYELTASTNLNIAANGSGNPRIDTIALRADWTLQTVRLVVLQGTPAGTPLPPTLTQNAGVRWEMPIADVLVNNGFISITNANITPRANWANSSPNVYLLDVYNNSGNYLVAGDVVVWDTSLDRAVKSSTTLNDTTVAGVWCARTGAGAYGRLLVKGIGPVNANAAITRGNLLAQSGTAKQAAIQPGGGLNQGVFAQALQTTTGAGLVTCYVDASLGAQKIQSSATVLRSGAVNYSSASTSFVDVDAANLILTVFTSTGRIAFAMTFSGDVTSAGGNGMYDVIVDGTTRYGGVNGSTTISESTGNLACGVCLTGRFTGLTPGSHTLKLQYRTSGTVVGILNNPDTICMMAWEI